MDKIEVRFSRVKIGLLMLLSLMFVALGVFVLSDADDTRGKIIGWACIIFFGFGVAVFFRQFLNTAPRIIIDDEGIEDVSLDVGKILWDDIVAAYPNDIMMSKFISLQVGDTEKYLRRTSKLKRRLASYNQTLGFETLNLNLAGLDISQKDLLALIEARLSISAKKAVRRLIETNE